MSDQKTYSPIPTVSAGDPIRASSWNRVANTLNRPYDTRPRSRGGGSASVAFVEQIIPARVNQTPGGPITGYLLGSEEGANFTQGETIQIYSWVKSPSPDPAGEPNGQLYVFVSEGLDGLWWYHAVDCQDPPPPSAEVPSGDPIPEDGTEVVYVQ